MRQPTRRCWAHGLTLVEVIIASVVVSFMVVGALNVVGGLFRTYAVTDERVQASILAQSLLHEILQTNYDDPDGAGVFGPEADERSNVRTDFDDVDDYQGWSASPPQQRDGTPETGCAGWTRCAQVVWVRVLDAQTPSATDSGLKRIDVSVTSPRGMAVTISALRACNGRLEWDPPSNGNVVTGVEAQVTLDANVPPMHLRSSLSNYVEGW